MQLIELYDLKKVMMIHRACWPSLASMWMTCWDAATSKTLRPRN